MKMRPKIDLRNIVDYKTKLEGTPSPVAYDFELPPNKKQLIKRLAYVLVQSEDKSVNGRIYLSQIMPYGPRCHIGANYIFTKNLLYALIFETEKEAINAAFTNYANDILKIVSVFVYEEPPMYLLEKDNPIGEKEYVKHVESNKVFTLTKQPDEAKRYIDKECVLSEKSFIGQKDNLLYKPRPFQLSEDHVVLLKTNLGKIDTVVLTTEEQNLIELEKKAAALIAKSKEKTDVISRVQRLKDQMSLYYNNGPFKKKTWGNENPDVPHVPSISSLNNEKQFYKLVNKYSKKLQKLEKKVKRLHNLAIEKEDVN